MSDALAPIALFAYNRPHHLAQVVAALLRDPFAAASDLHVFCDGPKTAAAAAGVAAVRVQARAIAGFRSVTVVEQERNIGLAGSIIAGVTALCNRYGRVIVLEDDIVVRPGFLDFMNRALTRYCDDERVMQVTGYMFPVPSGGSDAALFLPLISCWGWATWKRAWDRFDPCARGHAALQSDANLRRRFNLLDSYPYFEMLQRQMRGGVDSWGIRWYLSVFSRSGLVLWPPQSMVANIGFDGSGTHGDGGMPNGLGPIPSREPVQPYALPQEVAVDEAKLAQIGSLLAATHAPKRKPVGTTMTLRTVLKQLCPPILIRLLRGSPKAAPVQSVSVCGNNSDVHGLVEMREGSAYIAVGDDCLIQAHLVAETAKSRIVIGNNVFIGGGTTIDCADSVEIGDDVLISYECLLIDSDGHPTDLETRRAELPRWKDHGGRNWSAAGTKPIKIGRGAWLGARTILLKGVEVGEGAVVGAGSVVTRSVPPFTLAAGNPARIIRPLRGHADVGGAPPSKVESW